MTAFRDRDGRRLHPRVWAWLFQQPTYRAVARNIVVSTVDATQVIDVSTTWVGYDTELSDELPGWTRYMLFETIAVPKRALARRMLTPYWPAPTEADARRLHDLAVKWACERVTAPAVTRVPVVPARPRGGWTLDTRPSG